MGEVRFVVRPELGDEIAEGGVCESTLGGGDGSAEVVEGVDVVKVEAQVRVGDLVSAKEIGRVIEENRGVLLGLIGRVERDVQNAQDILSIATERALRYGPGQYGGKASVLSYVRKIAHNAACEFARGSMARKRHFMYENEGRGLEGKGLGGVMELVEDEGGDVERGAIGREELVRVMRVVEVLRGRYPEAMRTWEMYRLEGSDYDEICDELGISKGAARGQVHRMGVLLLEGLGGKRG